MKKLFSTPKRAVISTICIFIIVLLITAVASTIVLKSTLVGKNEAKAVALTDAGLIESEISGLRTTLDFDDGRFLYEVEFYSNGTEYEYVIQAKDGGIISRDIDGDYNSISANTKTNYSETQSAANTQKAMETQVVAEDATKINSDYSANAQSAVISEDEAKAAVLADAKLIEKDVTFVKIKLDKKKSVQVYDVEFYTSDAEYDYEINASDGTIIQMDVETFRNQTDSASSEHIGIDRAKEIAVSHAALTEVDVQFSKAKLENDDGRPEYEVEFYYGNTEYNYDIDALTGEILKYDYERN